MYSPLESFCGIYLGSENLAKFKHSDNSYFKSSLKEATYNTNSKEFSYNDGQTKIGVVSQKCTEMLLGPLVDVLYFLKMVLSII